MQRRILFVHTGGGIGDLLLSAPIAAAVTRCWPDATVTAWVRPAHEGLLAGNPCFAGCLRMDRRSLPAQYAALRRGRFDLAILPWTSARETVLAWLARIPVRVGQSGRLAYSWMFTVPVDIASAHGDSSRHWLDIQLDYVRALGFATEGARPYLYVSDQEREAARHLLTGHGIDPSARLCALHIGKGVPLTADRWPLARFVDVGRQMVAAGYSVVLIGSHAEQPLASRIATAVGTGASVISSGTVRELSALIGTMTVVITPDSGPGHIAAALGVPVVSIFALKAAPIARWRPWTPDHRVVTTAPWVCPKNCIKEKCRRFDCLEHFDPLQVVNAALELADCRGHD